MPSEIAVEAAETVDNLKNTDENGDFWWLSDVFEFIGYSGARQMNTEVTRAFSFGAKQHVVDAFDFLNVNIPTGGRPRMDWRMTRMGLYLLVMTCGAKSDGMDRLRACVAVLALG